MANSADQGPTDLDLHCLQGRGISGFSRTKVLQVVLIFMINMVDYKAGVKERRNEIGHAKTNTVKFHLNSLANSGDPDQMPRCVASDQGLNCWPHTADFVLFFH